MIRRDSPDALGPDRGQPLDGDPARALRHQASLTSWLDGHAKEWIELRSRLDRVENGRLWALAELVKHVRTRSFRPIPGVLGRLLHGHQRRNATERNCAFLLPPVRSDAPRILAVVDDFTALGMSGDCLLRAAVPGTSSEAIKEWSPDMLFVESAWNANGGAWKGKVAPLSPELVHLVLVCRALGVPTVFWNKEDPVHFTHFIDTARHFDVILTTDHRCVDEYRGRLGMSEDVRCFPFACQPRVHHPFDAVSRKDAAFFAGSFYPRHRERSEDLSQLLLSAAEVMPLDILDRNFGEVGEFLFPEDFRQYIRGSVDITAMPSVYRSYRFGVNVNTVTASSSMLSRRAVELAATRTVIISNRSNAHHDMLDGGVLEMPESAELREYARDPRACDELLIRAWRRVMSLHTWSDRMSDLLEHLGIRTNNAMRVEVIAPALNKKEAEDVRRSFDKQRYPFRRLWVWEGDGLPRLVQGEDADFCEALADAHSVAFFHPADLYGPLYLDDLVLALKCQQHDVAGAPLTEEPEFTTVGGCGYRRIVLRGTLPVVQVMTILGSLSSAGFSGRVGLAAHGQYSMREGGCMSNASRYRLVE